MNSGPAYKATVRIYCMAGIAKPSPKIGQALGPLGINMMQFCKEFNERTGKFKEDTPMRVKLIAYVDRSYKFVVKPPPSSWFIKKAASVTKGSPEPSHTTAARISIKYLYEIAKIKHEVDPDLRIHDVEAITKMLIGSANSMGIDVVEDTFPPQPLKVDV
uniref:Large ribosomal subunit protein uL11m n=1 Tax=Strombidium rassoulzadegani TaxID=1082188 RepID=A0A7S3CU35_9SPIT|mmetsp:Transcript_8884/g.15078  ORF Transcript_8884/g.15078 Transcript_8884/m.15078 type:complete len:160 (+) Transcript_8884:14-493(+)|eukprot:CAMPEP_0168628318 /NCGR_PEP_ID=MMETSP0449_2-20121227/11778_1 /TAXON_ID=1082188 /ORGANISM="Strombidium rassoulzadegani, Strain ras09" /LENGTH=159 /DNA_ID=CAMNT_0008670725 /DNA_START=14 /DNA_END=493 /DNA_ORIENTATION=+